MTAPAFDARVPTLLDGLVGKAPTAPSIRAIAARARAADVSARTYLVLRSIAAGIGLWITRHGLLSAEPAGADIYGHAARTDFALAELFRHGRLDGWYPGLGSGYRLFMVNGPGLALVSGLVQVLSLGRITTVGSFALLGAASVAALPPAVSLLSRELGTSRLAAALHGVLALFVSFYGGGGLAGLYGPGLIAQTIALPLQVVALGLVLRAVRLGGGPAIGRAAAVVAGLALLHPISILVLALFVPLGASRHWLVNARRLPRALAVGAWAAALAGLWLLPAMRDRDLAGPATAWTIPPLPTRLAEVARGDVLLPRAVALSAAAAIVITVVAAVRHPALRRRLPPVAGAALFLTAAHLAVGHHIGPYDLVVQLPTRGLALATFLLLLPLAELLGDTVQALRSRLARTQVLGHASFPDGRTLPPGEPWARPLSGTPGDVSQLTRSAGHPQPRRHPAPPMRTLLQSLTAPPLWRERRWSELGPEVAATVATAALALAVPWLLSGLLDPRQEALPPSPELVEAAQVLDRVVPPMGRHLLVTPPPTAPVGTDMPARWLAVASGTNSAHLYFWEATQENAAGILSYELTVTVDPADAVATLRRLGVTHLVTTDTGQEQAFARTRATAPTWWSGPYAISELLAEPGRPSPAALLQPAAQVAPDIGLAAEPLVREAEHLEWDVGAPQPLPVVAAVAYDPHWHAEVDGVPVEVERSSEGLVQVRLPAGQHRLTLHYTGGRPDPLGLMLTLVGLAALFCLRSRSTSRVRGDRTGVSG